MRSSYTNQPLTAVTGETLCREAQFSGGATQMLKPGQAMLMRGVEGGVADEEVSAML